MAVTFMAGARFERTGGPQLRAVAYVPPGVLRLAGSVAADDAVQEAWLRLSRTDSGSIENLGGWLTTVVARVCLDMLRSRTRRGEESLDKPRFEPFAHAAADPEQESLLAESIGLALLVVLDRLDPPERLAFVLHDMFGVTFDEIASVVGRSPAAARQLACRARRRVRATTTAAKPDLIRQREVVDNLLPLAALRGGDIEGLLAVLDSQGGGPL